MDRDGSPSAGQDGFDAQRFRQALGAFATGVTIITARDALGADVGMTANSFNSVSLTPPMVLWSLGRSSTNIAAFLQAKHFAVHVLATDQDSLATRFAQRGIDRFAGLALARGAGGIPLLEGVSARFECRTAFQYEGGDHVIFVGEVLAFEHWEREPLVWKRGRYALAVGKSTPPPHKPPLQLTAADAFEQDLLVHLLGRAHHQLYARVQAELSRRGLSEPEYFALRLLGLRDGLRVAELDAVLAPIGTRIDQQVAAHLEQLGLVSRASDAQLRLTEAGRRAATELLALAQAACAEGERALDPSDSHALRHLLERLIAATAPTARDD